MTPNALGNFIRERRMDLGLTQEALAERVGPSVRQAEISRLERGQVVMPRRRKMEQIAIALEVSLGSLLQCSGWLTDNERDEVDERQIAPTHQETSDSFRDELTALRDSLQLAIERLSVIESRIPA